MEHKNYNIKIDSPAPSSNDILKHKDFDTLLGKFEAAPNPAPEARIVSVNFWQYGIGALIAGAAAVAFLFYNPLEQFKNGHDPMTVRNFIDRPFKEIPTKFASYKFPVNQGGEFYYGDEGSKIIVPPAAFVDKDGKDVHGEVNLTYREFHDYIDFFLSGIPMDYDSAGTTYQLESAGMMELDAKQNGNTLNIKPQKSIKIELMSNVAKNKDLNYNIYYLDEELENWTYQCKDKIDKEEILTPIQQAQNESRQIRREIKRLNNRITEVVRTLETENPEPLQPVRPEAASSNDYVFNFEVERNEFPEIAAYDNVLWKVGPNNPPFQQRWYNVSWDDVKLTKISEQTYKVKLIAATETIDLLVSPVLSGNDLIQARTEFDKKFQIYQTQFAERQDKIKEKLAKRTIAIKERKAELIAKEQAVNAKIKKLQLSGNNREAVEVIAQQKIKNQFEVGKLGIWNCDTPLLPYEQIIVGKFENEHHKKYNGNAVYHVDKSQNTVSSFYISGNDKILYSKNSENLLWLITKEGKLAIVNPNEFNRIEHKKEHTFVMKTINKPIKSEDDIRKILKFN